MKVKLVHCDGSLYQVFGLDGGYSPNYLADIYVL